MDYYWYEYCKGYHLISKENYLTFYYPEFAIAAQ